MPISIDLFDFDGLDGLIVDSAAVVGVWMIILAMVMAIMIVGECVHHLKRRSPVEKLVRRRLR